MINLNITKVQIEYLLFIKNYEGKKTITEASLFFNCSRANSKDSRQDDCHGNLVQGR